MNNEKLKETFSAIFIGVLFVGIIFNTISLIVIAVGVTSMSHDEKRLESIESMNRVQQRQLNDLMYPGVYNGVH